MDRSLARAQGDFHLVMDRHQQELLEEEVSGKVRMPSYHHDNVHTHTTQVHVTIPEGTSTDARGILISLSVERTVSNGSLTVVPLKLKPKMASTTTW